MSDFLPTAEFLAACQTVGFSLSTDELNKLTRFLNLLLETNKQFNLTAIAQPEHAWMRHILDSLSLLPHLGTAEPNEPNEPAEPADSGEPDFSRAVSPPAPVSHDAPVACPTIIDVGSGGGLPGIPLAICLPQANFTLLEATGKKAHFLEAVVADLKLPNVRVINERAETLGQNKNHRQQYDFAIARAVGPLNVLLELTLPFVKIGGYLLAMKGARAETELADATDAVMLLGGGEFEVFEALPGLDDDAVIIEIAKADQTPKKYPRLPGEPKLHPL